MSNSSYSYSRVEGTLSGVAGVESGSEGKLCPRTKSDSKRAQHNSAYVPHNRLSRYATALVNLTPVRFKWSPGLEIPLDKIGLCSSVSFSWLNEYIFAGYKNEAKDKTMPALPNLDSCRINGTRMDGLWHAHIVERGQAGASVPRIVWQFVRTRVLMASFVYLLGIIISFGSPIIVLRQIISGMEDRSTLYSIKVDQISKNDTIRLTEGQINSTRENLLGLKSLENSTATNLSSIFEPTGVSSDSTVLNEMTIFVNIVILIFAEIISCFLRSWSASINLRTSTRLRSACLAVAYKKLVRSSIRCEASAHRTIMHRVPNSETLYELIANGPRIFSGPLIMIFWSLLVWHSMGHWALVGIFVLATLYSCTILTTYLARIFGERRINYSLEGMSMLREFTENAFLAKVTLWDKYFLKKILDARENELEEMRLEGLSEGWNLCMAHAIPVITVGTSVMACILTDQQIIAKNFIPCLVLVTINLKYCMLDSWLAASSISRGITSLNKLKTVLILKDADRFTDKPIDKNLAVTINHGHFTWEKDKPVLDKGNKRNSRFYVESGARTRSRFVNFHRSAESLIDINFYAPKSKLIGICGGRDSGKSSLLLALMGHLNRVGGRVTMDGTCSYVAQMPRLFDGTLKENIVFGENFDTSWYYKTVRSCNLTEFAARLPAMDDTRLATIELELELKQKIVLARAVYCQRDINFLDDPLSDVEPEESVDIFEKSIVQALGTKTVIVISDREQFLSRCDTVYVMKEGTIVEQGTHEELQQWGREYTELLDSYGEKYKKKYHGSGDKMNSSINQFPSESNEFFSNANIASNFDTDEEAMRMNENQRIPIRSANCENALRIRDNSYVKSMGGWYPIIAIVILSGCFAFPIASSPLVFVCIGQKTIGDTTRIAILLSSIMGLVIFSGILLLATSNKVVLTAARRIHEKWLRELYEAQISFFAASSSRLLLNICSLNLREVDSNLPRAITALFVHTGIILFSIIVLGILSIWFLVPVAVFVLSSIFYVAYARGLTFALYEAVQRDSILPIYIHTVDTIAGRAVIQAYNKEREFTKRFHKHCDDNSIFDFMLRAVKLWTVYRIKIISVLIIGIILLIGASLGHFRNRCNALGIAFVCALQLTTSIVRASEAFSMAYPSLANVDAIHNYFERIPKEKICNESLPDDWPREHSIKFKDVLFNKKSPRKPFSIAIGPGEKIALIGIRSSLKLSFVGSLYKFIEITSGDICVNDANIGDIGTEKLRKSINFVASEPILFDGSVRYNLDPNDEKTDKALTMALQRVHLWERVSGSSNKLDSPASILTKTWERKLLFLARALLNNFGKILIVEESIKRIRHDEDDIVDQVLLDVFPDHTIIALSNRGAAGRYVKKCYYLDDGTIIEAPLGRVGFVATR